MTTRIARALVVAAIVILLVAVGRAAAPVFWQTSTRADFAKGETENLSVDNDGRLILGPAMRLLAETNAPFLWTMMPAADGSMFVGTGSEGKVFRVTPDGKVSVFYDAPELEVHALALAPDGGLYVATSPDGKIYKVDARGAASVFFDPADKYIWSLVVDASGTVYAGTGEKGTIYKIAPDGKGAAFYQTKATHVLSLAIDKSGNLLAGTESPGRVFRIDRQGKAFVLLDSAYREIRSLNVAADGSIYVAAVSPKGTSEERPAEAGSEAGRQGPVPMVSTEITSMSMVDISGASTADLKLGRREERRPPKGAVYQIAPDGTSETVWESPDDLPYDVSLDASGQLLVGTGNKGKIFRLTRDNPPKVTSLVRVAAQQVMRVLTDAKGLTVVATSNPGKVFRLSPERAEQGTYESDVRDAQTVSAWGVITWRGSVSKGSEIQLFTRAGNSDKPDDTWSAWSEPYRNADGQQITSPKARFLQWKAVLRGKESPVLTSVTVAYLQRNLRPRVSSITVYPPGTVFQRPFSTGEMEIAGLEDQPDAKALSSAAATSGGVSGAALTPPLGRRVYQKGLQTFIWKADDENDDKLSFDVFYRREGDTRWKILKQNLSDAILVWDTTAVPNGTYQIKVAASDAPSNPPGAALVGELESATLDVDNTPPTIRFTGLRREAGRTILLFDVRDDQSVVQRVDYSIEAEHWRPIYPKDGLADSRFEEFELVLPPDTAPDAVVIRAVDSMSNVATARGTVPPDKTESDPTKARIQKGKSGTN
jgi:sugar lactone lactonase YvrE